MQGRVGVFVYVCVDYFLYIENCEVFYSVDMFQENWVRLNSRHFIYVTCQDTKIKYSKLNFILDWTLRYAVVAAFQFPKNMIWSAKNDAFYMNTKGFVHLNIRKISCAFCLFILFCNKSAIHRGIQLL